MHPGWGAERRRPGDEGPPGAQLRHREPPGAPTVPRGQLENRLAGPAARTSPAADPPGPGVPGLGARWGLPAPRPPRSSAPDRARKPGPGRRRAEAHPEDRRRGHLLGPTGPTPPGPEVGRGLLGGARPGLRTPFPSPHLENGGLRAAAP